MRYEDEFGIVWQVDTDGTLLPVQTPKWPATDDEFLKLAKIEPIGELDED